MVIGKCFFNHVLFSFCRRLQQPRQEVGNAEEDPKRR